MLTSQSAPLPLPALAACVAAFASGDVASGDRQFESDVVSEVAPIIRAAARRVLRNESDQEDAAQEALAAVWRKASTGMMPNVRLVANAAAIDFARTSTGMGDSRYMTPGERDATYQWKPIEHASIAAVDHAEDDGRIARLPEHLREVATLLANGRTFSEVAHAKGMSHRTVRRYVSAIRERFMVPN